MSVLRKCRPVPILIVLGIGILWGCARNDRLLGYEVDEQPGSFTPQDDGGPNASSDAGGDAAHVEELLCIGTECPAPFATCGAESGPVYKCGTDLAHDPKNCGSCGNECLVYEPIGMTSRCVDGACELECLNNPNHPTDRRNCNGEIDDGCEVDVLVDHDNCGACGKACADGVPCLDGKCGCPQNLLACETDEGIKCIDPKTNDDNCGKCGNACKPPSDACDPTPANAYYGCVGGTCGHMKCGGVSADCNNDIGSLGCASDGCEVQDLRTDRNNCGGCGIKCKGAEECINEGFGYECAVPCARFGRVVCPFADECVDLLHDVNNCGGCGNFCPLPGPNQVRSCDKGLCASECAPGFADCNGISADGCETNLRANPGNCGACGNACDIGAGQPCVEGKCLMKACDGEVTK
jgi:hypothetical protein